MLPPYGKVSYGVSRYCVSLMHKTKLAMLNLQHYVGFYIGLILVKEEGRTGLSEGWQGCSKGFPEGEARGKFRGAALPARGKPRPSRLFYSDLHSISNTVFQSTEVSRRVHFFTLF